jgi:hypothetical protein
MEWDNTTLLQQYKEYRVNSMPELFQIYKMSILLKRVWLNLWDVMWHIKKPLCSGDYLRLVVRLLTGSGHKKVNKLFFDS